MRFYDLFMHPLEKRVLKQLRTQLISKAKGDVLEIGLGTGVNLSHYDEKLCRSLTAVDRTVGALSKSVSGQIKFSAVEADAANLPFDDNTFDTVVETLLLCSVADVSAVLGEIRRVLKPGGLFIHIDHGLPLKTGLRRLFKALAPVWYGMTRSCRIDRTFQPMMASAGFKSIEDGYAGKSVFYWGLSKKLSS